MSAEILHILANAGIALDDNGDLQDQERLVGGRRLATGEPQRYPFTPDDDARLWEWVTRAEAQGIRIKPKIFADLEKTVRCCYPLQICANKQSPRHTAGSWRARWRKIRDGIQDVGIAYTGELEEGSQNLGIKHGVLVERSQKIAKEEQGSKNVCFEQRVPKPSMEQHNTQPDTNIRLEHRQQDQTLGTPHKQPYRQVQTLPRPLNIAPPASAFVPVPSYAPARSRAEPGQIRAWEWMAESGRRRFLAHEELLLSRWGVKPTHHGTCVPVPQLWATVDPAVLLTTFDHTAYTQLSEVRLVCPLPCAKADLTAAGLFNSRPLNSVGPRSNMVQERATLWG